MGSDVRACQDGGLKVEGGKKNNENGRNKWWLVRVMGLKSKQKDRRYRGRRWWRKREKKEMRKRGKILLYQVTNQVRVITWQHIEDRGSKKVLPILISWVYD